MDDIDGAVRTEAFSFLADLQSTYEDNIPRARLLTGFNFRGQRVPLVGPSGIFKPAVLPEMPLTITTAPMKDTGDRPYADEWVDGDLIRYKYRGDDPDHYQNVGLRKAFRAQVPMIYLYGTVRGFYAAAFPAYIVGDDRANLTFTVAIDDYILDITQLPYVEDPAPRRAYVTRLVRQRLHQQSFRQRVIAAYRTKCAVCRLRHSELLDAAHILPDTDPRAEPLVSNGLALCRLHHGAFDHDVIGIRPDYVVEIRRDVLLEIDGPMLVHGLQGFHGTDLLVPPARELRPNRDFLAERYERFRAS